MNAKWIGADLLQTVPDEFFVLTEQDLDEYPAIRDAITNQGTGKVNYDEFMHNHLCRHVYYTQIYTRFKTIMKGV